MTTRSANPPSSPSDRSEQSERRPSALKKLAFATTVTVLFFGLLELTLGLAGVSPRAYEDDPYVGFSGYSPLFVEATGDDGTVVMERSPAKQSLFNPQSFPLRKAPDATRIFCVGGSTTFGRPYGDRTSFCGWLREFLAVAEPGRRWEVINAGGISYASYRVALLMEELARYEPDLFVVYSGHNEFLERRTYRQIIATPKAVRGLGALASRTRTWTALDAVLSSSRRGSKAGAPQADVLGTEVVTLLDDAVGPDAYTRDDRLREQALRHYRFNLARMVEIADSVRADVVMVTPASNLRDSSPFKSEQSGGLTESETQRWRTLVQEGFSAFRAGDPDEAIVKLRQAVAMDSRFADLQFALGRALYAVGRYDEALGAFERARDEDVCPLRALGPMAGIVREVAEERGVRVVDFERMAADRSEHRIPGSNLFLDHVHPTIEGNRMLARAILDALTAGGTVTPGLDWGDNAAAEVVARVEGSLDASDHATALTNLAKVIGWAGKHQEAYRLSQQAVELDPNDVQVQYHAGLMADLLGRHDEAMAHYRKAIEILPTADLPHGNLAVGLEREGRLAEAVEHYRIAYRYSSDDMKLHNRDNLANALLKYGYTVYGELRYDDAVALLEEADRVRPGDPGILNRLATALMASGRPDDAVERLQAAIRARPGDGGAYNRLALAHALAGRPAEAAEAYGRALELDAKVAQAPDNLFTVLDRMGRTELAAEIRSTLGAG